MPYFREIIKNFGDIMEYDLDVRGTITSRVLLIFFILVAFGNLLGSIILIFLS